MAGDPGRGETSRDFAEFTGASAGVNRIRTALLFLGFAAVTLVVQHGALQGPFISDDFKDIVNNPYLGAVSRANLLEIANPWGDARLFTANYAPVHLFAHMLERLVFGNDMLGYHVVNALVHAWVSTLLVLLFRRSGIPPTAALLGAAWFSLHPASVEAVAWISQLKTNAAMAFTLGAVLARRRSESLAAVLFALGLLTKTSAVSALPLACALSFVAGFTRRDARWLAVWSLIFVLYAVPQLGTYNEVADYQVAAFSDPWAHLRSILAYWMRYLAMAATASGVSAFQEPGPALSWADPWFLGGFVATGLLGWRSVVALRERRAEGAFWIFAAAGFGPVSQIFPFLYPVGDRYLYFILPGLIGGAITWGLALRAKLEARPSQSAAVRRFAAASMRALPIVSGCVILSFAVQSSGRAALWVDEKRLVEEGIRNYPEGEGALFQRACQAGIANDLDRSIDLLRRAAARGVNRFDGLLDNPCFVRLRDEPRFVAFVVELTQRWLEEAERRDVHTQAMWLARGRAHATLKHYRKARAAYLEALDIGGPQTALARSEIDDVIERQAERRAQRKAGKPVRIHQRDPAATGPP